MVSDLGGSVVAHAGNNPAENNARNRYYDSLRAVALFRVLIAHTWCWAWLAWVFPSMGVLFALAGSLMAASLDRAENGPLPVLKRRLRRLLPPLWALAVVIVPLMLYLGWTADTVEGSEPFSFSTVWLWLLPVATPPGSDWGMDYSEPLWYIATYLWFVLLSPMLLWLFRRWPLPTLAMPLVLVSLMAFGLLNSDGRVGAMALEVSTYALSWMVGFAHHDGWFRRLGIGVSVLLGIIVMTLGGVYAVAFPDPYMGANLLYIPVASALYGAGFAVVVFSLPLTFSWMKSIRPLDRLVRMINSRAVTIYIWGNVAMMAGMWVFYRVIDKDMHSWTGGLLLLLFILATLCVIALAVGWVEDLAANRKPRLIP